MAKLSKDTDCNEESLALEMIELNIQEWDSLTKVFSMIERVCSELQSQQPPALPSDEETIH